MAFLLDEHISHRLKLCSKAKRERLAANDERDFEWVTNFVKDPKDARDAVIEMMKDLATAAWAQRNGTQGSWRKLASVIETGILFIAQCNSRPGPWKFLTTDTIQEMTDSGKEYWTAIKGHKQVSIRGAHGCYLCPGALKSAEVYMGMSGRKDNQFWLLQHTKLDYWLKEACAVYLPSSSRI